MREVKNNIKAIAFDIDGTLYPSWKFYFRLLPFIIKNYKFMKAFGTVRKEIRRLQTNIPFDDFFVVQSKLMSKYLNATPEIIKQDIENKIYKGWKPIFKKIQPFKEAKNTIQALKIAGFKIALLSDFTPEQKEDVWGILPFCDVSLGAENTGAVKPSEIPFKALAEKLNLKYEEILYVGNNIEYDINGAKKLGMKTAYICPIWKRFFSIKPINADIWFSSYNNLQQIILSEKGVWLKK